MLNDLQAVLGACRVGKSRQLTQDLNYRRAGELQPLLLHPLGSDRQTQPEGTPPSAHTLGTALPSPALVVHYQDRPLLCADPGSLDAGPRDPTEPTSAVQTAAAEGPLLFSNTAVGGTFDRLHAGHRILLAATALVTTTLAFVGVTSRLPGHTSLMPVRCQHWQHMPK